MTYERITATPVREVLRLAEQVLLERIPLRKTGADKHSVELSGGDGTAKISAHKHGLETVVHVDTDQLRTSRLDTEVQYFLTLLPYQTGDRRGGKEALPGGLPGRVVT
jgi:hypothetical protein